MRDSDKAYHAIVDMLVYGELRGGQAISDDWLQKEIKVGKTPTREALLRLTQDGYITAVPHSGMFVTIFDVAQLESILSLRTVLAELLSRRLVENARAGDIDAFEREMRGLIRIGERMTPREVCTMDISFHRGLGRLSGDRLLSGILEKLEIMSNIAMRPHVQEYYYKEEDVKAEYFDIIHLIRARDSEGLEGALKRHIPKYILQRQ